MKAPSTFTLAVLLASVLFLHDSHAEDYTRWNLPEGAVARLGKGGLGRGDRAVVYSPDGARLAAASAIGIWLYDADTGAEVALFTGHTGWVRSVSFSPDGTTLASGSEDGTILLWDMSPYVTPQPSTSSDFDGDCTVGFPDFLLSVAQFGSIQGDAGYDARYDLDGDGTIGFGDFVIFARGFGKEG